MGGFILIGTVRRPCGLFSIFRILLTAVVLNGLLWHVWSPQLQLHWLSIV